MFVPDPQPRITTLRAARALTAALIASAAAVAIAGPIEPTHNAPSAQYAVPTTPDASGRILVAVRVNGRGPFRFMLDTGANRTALAGSLLPLLELQADQAVPVLVSGINGSMQVSTVRVRTLDAGALHLHDIQIPVLSGPVLADIDGILGLDALNHRTLTADFLHDHVAIAGSFATVPVGEAIIPARIVSEHLLEIDARIGGVPVQAILDTGGAHTLGNRALLAALLHGRSLNAFSTNTAVVDANAFSRPALIEQVSLLQFGSAWVRNLYVTFGDFRVFDLWGLKDTPALLLGMDVIGGFEQVTIDYHHREIGLLPRRG